MSMGYVKPERLSLRADPRFSEKWIQGLIASDPSILGLGDLVLRDQERIQPRAGRLDLLLQDVETKRRYEVELQLGPTDEAHLVRTIEYWDLERKRYPQYEHCAVIIAEDVTSRFLNVIGLFNGSIPLIAIQMQALKVGDNVTLVFTTVMDELSRGLIDEDEDAAAAPTDRAYWDKRAKASVPLVDELFRFTQQLDSELALRYNKFYIGLTRGGRAFNFVEFVPQKTLVRLNIALPRSDEVDARVEASGLEAMEYDRLFKQYRVRITRSDLSNKADAIRDLMKLAFERKAGERSIS